MSMKAETGKTTTPGLGREWMVPVKSLSFELANGSVVEWLLSRRASRGRRVL